MEDLISRQALIDKLEGTDWYHINKNGELVHGSSSELVSLYKFCDVFRAIASVPAAEVAPVRHGRWKRVGDTAWECSACGCISCCNGTYCPDCGASMMEGAEDGQTG